MMRRMWIYSLLFQFLVVVSMSTTEAATAITTTASFVSTSVVDGSCTTSEQKQQQQQQVHPAFLCKFSNTKQQQKQRASSSKLKMMNGVDFLDSYSATNLWLATIDADIDSIPTNEFGTVFAGGIVVMLGGVLSALVVGFILERGDLYANVVADSYAQGGDDEAFWQGLSDEEQKKAREMLQKIKASKEGGSNSEVTEAANQVTEEETKVEEAPIKSTESTDSSPTKKVDMFSDYD